MIKLRDVSLTLGETDILHNITLDLAERRIGIVGSNGSGKSSFARLLNGLRTPTSGDVIVDGINTRDSGKTIRQKVGFVFQNPDNQIVFPIVLEDVEFGLKNLGFDATTRTQKAHDILTLYGIEHLKSKGTHQLSGGQKQLLALAGVLVMEPDYVVLDEPTTLLDLRNKIRIAQAIDDLKQTAIVVTHDLDLLSAFDRVIAFENGHILADDVPAIALKRYREAMTDA